MQNHITITDGLLHDMLSIQSLCTTLLIEGAVPPHSATQWDTHIADTNRVTKDIEYKWLIKDERSQKMTDREIIEWKRVIN